MLGDLRREGLYERISLGGLDRAAVAALVRGSLGSDAAAARLHDETGGNPFFLGEVVRHLREAGDAGGIPESVRDVLGRRLSRLSDAANRTLAVAAVAGREYELALLEALEPLAGVAVLDALEEAVAAQLVREDADRPGRYGFAHPLVRETVYEELSLTRRVRLHGAVADALERLHGGDRDRLTELAGHRLAAAAGADPAEAVDVALRAGRHCMAELAYEEAAAMAARALEALGDGAGPLHTDALLLLGEASLRSGDEAGARDAFARAADIARRVGDAGRLARAALGASRARSHDHRRARADGRAPARGARRASRGGRATGTGPGPARDRDLLRLGADGAQGRRRRGGRARAARRRPGRARGGAERPPRRALERGLPRRAARHGDHDGRRRPARRRRRGRAAGAQLARR